MKQPESVFSSRVARDLATLRGAWFERIQQQATRGTPDRLGCIVGRFIALELKASAKAKVEKLQSYKLGRIADAGGIARVVYPENWDEEFGFLQTLQHKE